jgi:hypothetical protein
MPPPAGTRAVWLDRGMNVCDRYFKSGCPPHTSPLRAQARMQVITIGIDPHKSSLTAVAIDTAEHKIDQRRFTVNAGTFTRLMRWCKQRPERRFAIEGAGGLGRSLAHQLVAAGEML